MIPVKKIVTHFDYMGDSWMKARLGMITASAAGCLISKDSDKGKFTQGAMTYLKNLAGERVIGKAHKGDFSNPYTDHGNATEPEAIDYFCKETGLYLLKNEERGDTHRVLINDEYSLATPDALVSEFCRSEDLFDSTGTYLKAETLEVKSPTVSHRFISLFSCVAPLDLKKIEKDYYWQVIMQLMFSGGLRSHWAVYNRDYPTPMRRIVFEKLKLMDDIKKMHNTLHFAKMEINKIVESLKQTV